MGLITIAIIGSYSYIKARSALMQRTFDQLTSLRFEKKTRIEDFFRERKNDLISLSSMEDSKKMAQLLTENQDSAIQKLAEKYMIPYLQAGNFYTQAFIYSKNQATFLMQLDSIPAVCSLVHHKKLLKAISGMVEESGISIYELYDDQHHENQGFLISRHIPGTKDAWLILNISTAAINSIMFENNPHNGLGKSGESYLVGDDLLMRSTSRFQDNAAFNTKVDTKGVREALAKKSAQSLITDYRGIDVLSSYSPVDIPGLNWVILAEIDKQEAMVPVYTVRSSILFLSLIVALLVFGLVALLSSIIASPIKKLRTATESVAGGNYGHVLPIESNDEISDLIAAFNHMTSELKEKSERLEEERQLRLSSMIDGQEMERQRLSREIHDSLGQSVLAIKLKTEQYFRQNTDISDNAVQEIRRLFSEALNEIRAISRNLMPAVLSEFGIAEAISNLAADTMKISGIEIDFSDKEYCATAGQKTENYLYRICQEALNNAIRHSEASSIRIILKSTKDHIFLSIKDNGIGFQKEQEEQIRGNGLNHIKERAELLGGRCTIEAPPNKGCFIEIIVPIEKIA